MTTNFTFDHVSETLCQVVMDDFNLHFVTRIRWWMSKMTTFVWDLVVKSLQNQSPVENVRIFINVWGVFKETTIPNINNDQ